MKVQRYYTLPLRTDLLIKGKEHPSVSLKQSIADFIHLVLTTTLGECKFEPDFGCPVWDWDFDVIVSAHALKDQIQNAIKQTIEIKEKRLSKVRVEVKLIQEEIFTPEKKVRIKRKLDIKAGGIVIKTNEPFDYFERVYIGPISYS